jgi:glutathione synthase/RimK-type ligase-like ATP-grasp enzyme
VILIITIKDDLHAIRVSDCLARKGYNDCYILEVDQISNKYQISWQLGRKGTKGSIWLSNDTNIKIEDVDLIWWRRVRADQQFGTDMIDDFQMKLINNDCRGAIAGVLESNFKGKWLSDPAATDRASNKIYQLSIARECGFRVPETLISQSKEEVIEFNKRLKNEVIVKPVVGAAGPLLFARFLQEPEKLDSISFQRCPAVYQEFIGGTKHIRLNCFGNKSYAGLIETEELDWRPNLNIPISAWEVPESLHMKVRMVLDRLGLEMGIIDIKQTAEGEFVWLEVNPQGQFLFLEPLTKVPLTDYFADYLLSLI